MQTYHTFAFYNVENLFDPIKDSHSFDDEFTPNGKRNWTKERYENKVGKIGKAISEIGFRKIGFSPTIVGVSEIENDKVLKDLINGSHLNKINYKFIHFDSKDERGIDVALLYNADEFIPEYAEPIVPPRFLEKDGREDFTRDVLYVKGKIKGVLFHIFTIHLPSQRNHNINKRKRDQIAQKIKQKLDYILLEEEQPLVVVMGDFNTNPDTETLRKYFKTTYNRESQEDLELYNPMEIIAMDGQYTTKHRQKWILYDQMLFSKSFLDKYNTPQLIETQIFNPYFLQEWNKRFQGQPFRTYIGRKYLGGYSDHFPVYSIIKI